MSSVNPFYTFPYSQPEEYRFSHDSVFLARQAFEAQAPESLSSCRGLDLCAGSGVIGLDFIFHAFKEFHQCPKSFDFIEVQDVYRPHFEKNWHTLRAQFAPAAPTTQVRFLNANYADLLRDSALQQTYDLILCNPPYFMPGQGKLSPSVFKNRCRFYLDSDFRTLLEFLLYSLAPTGEAHLLLRDLQDHGFHPFAEAEKILSGRALLEKAAPIRGTDVLRLRHRQR